MTLVFYSDGVDFNALEASYLQMGGSERSFGGGRTGGSFFKGDEGGTGNEAEDGDGATGEERFEVQPVGPGDFW